MGNGVKNDGQQNLSEWATKFIRMGKQAATCEYALKGQKHSAQGTALGNKDMSVLSL